MFEIELIPDTEICEWMDGEIERLGEWFDGFEITWDNNETHHRLMLYSCNKIDKDYLLHPYGCGLELARIEDVIGTSLPTIQSAGRQLYFRLRKKYPSIHRDLGIK